jgi:microcystin-dependent protein
MALTVRPKRSYTASAVPSGLLAGEVAINAADKKVYVGSADGLSSILVCSLALSDHTGTTDNVTQGSTNKYYADSLARAALSSAATGLTYTSATGVISLTSGYSIPTTASQTNWDSAYTQRLQWDGGSTNLVASTARTSLGATTVGGNLLTLTNPSAITFPRINADNTISALDAATFRTAIGAGTSSTSGTVTSVAALTLGTTGTDLSSTIATGTTTPVITLNVPTASATNRGALSASDFTNFNTAYTNRITSLTTTGSSGAATLTTNVLNIPSYTLSGLGGQASSTNLTSLAGLSYVSASFVKMTAAGTFGLDTSTYLTANQSITLSGDVTGTGTTAISTTLATVAIAKGGTGQTTQQAAINALTGTQSSGKYVRSDGTNSTLASIQAADVPTLNQNTSGSSGSCTGNSATATKSTNLIGGNSTTLLGAVPYQSNTDTTSLLSPNTTTTKNFLSQTGTGTNGAAPAWSTVSKSDVGLGSVENTALSTWAGSSNITTLGTISTGTWSGTSVALNKGGTNAALTAAAGGVVYSTASAMAITAAGTAGQLLSSNGSSAPSWTNSPGVPTGSLMPYAGSAAPTGYLLCDGSSVSSSTYLALHAVISNTYGGSAYTGGAGLNFTLPDLRGRLPMGAGTGLGLNASGTGAPSGTAQTARTRGQWLGEETHLLSTSEMPSHNHTANTGSAGSHSHTPAGSIGNVGLGTNNLAVAGGSQWGFSSTATITNTVGNHQHTISAEGGGSRHAIIPPVVILNYIIKT